jgi:hypothetical protein
MTDLTLRNGLAATVGSGIRNNFEGTLTLGSVVLTDNTASQGCFHSQTFPEKMMARRSAKSMQTGIPED